MSIQPVPPNTGATTAGQLAARATQNDQALASWLGDHDTRIDDLESRSGTSVAGNVATYDELPASAEDGQSWIVRSREHPVPHPALYTWSGMQGAWTEPVSIQGAATDAAIHDKIVTPGTITRAALDARYAKQTHVTVGPDGDYTTVAAALAAFPAGKVDIEIMAGTFTETFPATITGVHNVTLRGQGQDTTTVIVNGPGIILTGEPTGWQIRDFTLKRADSTNTDDGISMDEPRRCVIERMRIVDFGGDSIHFGGGLHSLISHNYILARDFPRQNGHAGIHIGLAIDGDVATTITTERNYIGSGRQYGMLVHRANVGCIHVQDIVEHCDVGMRFEFCKSTLYSPYTEATNMQGIVLHDSLMPVIGEVRHDSEVIYTWDASYPEYQRRPLRIGRDFINPGAGVIWSTPNSGVQSNPETAPSLRWGVYHPEGVRTGVRGALWVRHDGFGPVLFEKRTGTGTTGWAPAGAPYPRPATDLSNAAHPVNTEGKYAGTQSFSTTANRPVWATGSSATSTWVWADGTTAYTPA